MNSFIAPEAVAARVPGGVIREMRVQSDCNNRVLRRHTFCNPEVPIRFSGVKKGRQMATPA